MDFFSSDKGKLRLKSPSPRRRRRSFKMEPRPSRVLLVVTVVALAACLWYNLGTASSYQQSIRSSFDSFLVSPSVKAANATLGFGAIVAVSHATSPRKKTLLTAASITGLDITIPEQPVWTDEDIQNFKDPHKSKISRGSTLAWLGHLNVLRWFLSTDLETVLILEDDVDWDIHLRTTQVPSVAAAVRTLLDQQRRLRRNGHHANSSAASTAAAIAAADLPPPSKFLSPEAAGGYWGNTSPRNPDWELLYLGHCGDFFPSQTWTNKSIPHYPSRLSFPDATLPNRENMHIRTRDFLDDLHIPEQTRLVHKSVFPLCTFGFALTRQAAEKLLYKYAYKETEGGGQAYDVRILEACRDLGFECWSTNPELFHHQNKPSLIETIDRSKQPKKKKSKEQIENEEDARERREKQEREERAALKTEDEKRRYDSIKAAQRRIEKEREDEKNKDKDGKVRKEEEEEKPKDKKVEVVGVDDTGRLIGAAPNIRCGARGVGMFSEDPETLEYLREVVGRQGRCLRDEFAEEMSKWP